MICLYAVDESLFEHNGLGILDNDLKKCQVEEELNNLYTLTAQYPLGAKFGKSIRNGMIIKAPTPNGDQLFRIYQSKPSMGMLEIHAFHIFYDLAFNFVEDTNIVSKSGQAWLQQLSQNTQYSHPFTFFSDISTVAGSRVVRKNCVEILLNTSLDNSFVNRFGGEILRDNFNVYFNRAIGENRGFKIRHKKNLKGYNANIDDKSVITRIMPIAFDGLLLPEKYVDSPRISDYPFPRIGKVEVVVKAAVGENADAKDAIPLNEAYTKMRDLIKEQFGVIDVPTCSYEVDFVELSKTKEYADFQNLETVRIGDTVTVSHDEDGFYVEAKVIRYEYDSLAGRLLRIEAGQFESRSSNNSINQQRSIEQQLEDVKIETSNMVQVAANGKNTIYRGVDRPTNANVGDLWYEPLENSVVLKQWSGVDWELLPISDQNLGNVNVNNLSGNYIDVRRFRISSGDRDILYVNEAGEVILNAKRIQVDFTDVATKTDLQEIELTPGPQGAPGVGIQSTTSTYGLSSSEATQPASWSASVPTLVKGQYLWTKNVWTYTDGRTETGYTKTYIPKDGNNGTDGIAGKDGVGISSTTITYASSSSGTTAPTSGWTTSVPNVAPGQYLWTKTVWTYTDNTNETGYSVARMGAPGVGIQSTTSTYGLSSSEATQPASWSASVPTLVKGQYLWTKNVWTYTDGRTETGYTKTYIPKDGNNGTNGIAGKDGFGISSTSITYASSSSGTTAPTSAWSTSVPTVSPGMFLWTKTIWTYSDNTTETGYSVARMGADGTGHLTTWTFYKLSNSTSAPQVVPIGESTNLGHLGPNNAWAPFKELSGRTEGWYVIDFDKIAKSDIIPDRPFTWYLEASFNGVSNFNGSTDFNIKFENWYVNSAGSTVFNQLGTRDFQANKFSATNDTAVINYFSQSITWTVPRAVYDAIPEGGFLNLRIRIDRFTKLFYHAKNSYVTYGTVPSDPAQRGLGNYSTYGWKASPEVATQALPYLWIYQIQLYDNGMEVAIPPTLIGTQGADGRTSYIHWAYSDNSDGTGLTSSDKGQRYIGHYSDYTQADSTDKTKYRWADRWAKIEAGNGNLLRWTTVSPENLKYFTKSNSATLSFEQKEGRDAYKIAIASSVPDSGNGAYFNSNENPDGQGPTFNLYPNCRYTFTFSVWSSVPIPFHYYSLGHHQVIGKSNVSGDIVHQHRDASWSVSSIKHGEWQRVSYSFTAISLSYFSPFFWYLPAGIEIYIADMMLSDGNIELPWEPSHLDLESSINSKADQALTNQQLNLLIEKAQQMQVELDARATMEALSDLERAYNAYVEANGKAVAKSENDLIEAGRRVDAIVETLGGLKKTKTFIDTYITEANEGIIIGTKDNVSQIRITYDRIAMYSAGKEVMYISQGVIHIDNGIFTKSLQIGRFVTSQHETNPDINICRYVG